MTLILRTARRFQQCHELQQLATVGIRYRLRHTTHDDFATPTKPTWSVDKLLSLYPKPSLSSATLTRLHRLSALNPPPAGSTEHETLKAEMEAFIKLVEAVKLVDTGAVRQAAFCVLDEINAPDLEVLSKQLQEKKGHELMKHASRVQDGFYLVDRSQPES